MTAASVSTTRRFVVIGGVVPVLIALASTILMITWIPELPNPVAIHWSGSGPDGFGSAWGLVFIPLGITVLYCAFSLGYLVNARSTGQPGINEKITVVMGVWLSVLLSVGVAGSVAMKRGLADAADAGDPALWLLAGAGIGLVLAGVAWLILPAADASLPEGEDPTAIRLAPGERVSWSRSARMSSGVLVLIAAVILLATVSLVVAALNSGGAALIGMATVVLVLVLAATTTVWRVSVDRRGLVVRGALGWPRITVPTSEIRAVQVVDVVPMADFGGWGFRIGAQGRRGIILRAGEAIEVTKANGKRFVVTVDDAHTGAGVLLAVVGQPSS